MFASERDVDFSLRPLITQEYLLKIQENKVAPVAIPRNMAPAYIVVSLGMIGLAATNLEGFKESMPLASQVVLGVVCILLAASYELH